MVRGLNSVKISFSSSGALFAIATLAFVSVAPGHAQDRTFNVASGAWTTGASWSPAFAPTITQWARIANGRTATIGTGNAAVAGGLELGNSTTSTGHVTMSDGSLTIGTVDAGGGFALLMRNASTYTQTGGTMSVAGTALFGLDGNSVFSVSAGSATFSNSLGVARRGTTSTLNISGTADVTVLNDLNMIDSVASGSRAAIVNLNGGMLTTNEIEEDAAGTSTFNFNGGTLRPTANNATFMQGLDAANVQAGGAKIDTNGFDIIINQPLTNGGGGGGLTKSGSGKLTVSNSNTYTGDTTVNGGSLDSTTGTLNVNAKLANTIGVGTIAVDNVNMSASTTGEISVAGTLRVDSDSIAASGTTGAVTKTGIGTLEIGASSSIAHTLAIGGDFLLSDGMLSFDLIDAINADMLDVDGDVTLDGTVGIILPAGLIGGESYQILKADSFLTSLAAIDIAFSGGVLPDSHQAVASIVDFDVGRFALQIDILAIPEPATLALWSLLGLSLCGWGIARTRRRK